MRSKPYTTHTIFYWAVGIHAVTSTIFRLDFLAFTDYYFCDRSTHYVSSSHFDNAHCCLLPYASLPLPPVYANVGVSITFVTFAIVRVDPFWLCSFRPERTCQHSLRTYSEFSTPPELLFSITIKLDALINHWRFFTT